MNTQWRKLSLFLASVVALYIVLVSIVADFGELFSQKHGVRLLIALLVAAVLYKGWEWARGFWRRYSALRSKLAEARDLLRRYGDNVLLCALTHWLFEQHVESIRVTDTTRLEPEKIVVLDVSQVPLKSDDHLDGMHFAITGPGGGERAKGVVLSSNPDKARLQLTDHQEEAPGEGDRAIPFEPPGATDLERVLGSILFIVRE